MGKDNKDIKIQGVSPFVKTTVALSSVERPDEVIKPQYPIIKIDRVTARNLMPMLMVRGIFANYEEGIPHINDIFENERKRLQRELTPAEEKIILTKTELYETDNNIVREFGNYTIALSKETFKAHLDKKESNLKQEISTPVLFEELDTDKRDKLKELTLYKLAHKIAFIILSAGFTQRTYDRVIINKEALIRDLGHTPDEKQIYQDIKKAFESLWLLEFVIWDYDYTETTKKHNPKSFTRMRFINTIQADRKNYKLWVNPLFVGCIKYLFSTEPINKKDLKKLLGSRAYDSFPRNIIPLTQYYSPQAILLTYFLVGERGNQKLNKKNHKVIAFRVKKYVQEANIQHSRNSRKLQDLIKALREIEIIDSTQPHIDELEVMKPSKALDGVLHIQVKQPVEDLEKHIQQIIESRENNLFVTQK